MNSTISPTTRAMLGFAADWPLAKKVATIDDFLANDYFHESGIMYCMWWWKGDDLRPYRETDFEGQDPFRREGLTPIGFMNNENSTSNSGQLLWSQCLRYQATRDPQALAYAARAFRSIDTVFKLTEGTPQVGFFCKPYQWQVSRESSPDQHYAVMRGLWQYRDICDNATKERIEFMLVSMAKCWIGNGYKLTFFGHDTNWLLANVPQYGPMFALLAHFAYVLTQDESYLRECRRVLELCGAWPLIYDQIRLNRRDGKGNPWTWPKPLYGREYDEERRPFLMSDWETRGAMTFVSGPAEYFLQHPDLVNPHLLRHVLGRVYRYIQFGLRDDLLQLYWEQVDLERDLWRPLPLYRTAETVQASPWRWHFMEYYSEVCSQDSLFRIIDACVSAHQHAYEFAPGALSLAQRILASLDGERLRTFVDPDGKQLLPPDEHLKHTLSSELSMISATYWRARLNGIALERGAP